VAKKNKVTRSRLLTSVANPLSPGHAVNLYKGNRTAFPDKGYLFSVVCTAHDTTQGVTSRTHAQFRLDCPQSFCPACRALADAATNA